MRTVRKKGKQTEIHWIESLKEIKYELNTKNYKKITPLFRDRNITGTWTGYMHKKHILYKDNFGYWRFKDITIDDRIVKMFRKYSNELAKKNRVIDKNNRMLKSDLFTNIKEPIKETIDENIEKISIRDAVRIFGKSDSYFRRIQREWKLSKPKAVFMYEGKVYFDLNELNKKFKKVFVEKIKEQPKVEIVNQPQVGLIRKFIKWLW